MRLHMPLQHWLSFHLPGSHRGGGGGKGIDPPFCHASPLWQVAMDFSEFGLLDFLFFTPMRAWQPMRHQRPPPPLHPCGPSPPSRGLGGQDVKDVTEADDEAGWCILQHQDTKLELEMRKLFRLTTVIGTPPPTRPEPNLRALPLALQRWECRGIAGCATRPPGPGRTATGYAGC